MCEIEKSIAEKILKDNYIEEYKHTEKVVELCKKFSKSLHIDNEILVLKAAWLHDIGKPTEDKYKKVGLKDEKYKHNSTEILSGILHELDYNDNAANDILEIILWHRGDFRPRRLQLECSILRICDKLSRYEKGKKDANRKCKNNIKEIIEYLEYNIERFEEIYDELREQEKISIHNIRFKP